MKLATRAAVAALALTSWAAQAATFEVPLTGWWRYDAYTEGPCTNGPYDFPAACIDGNLAGEVLTVTTPSAADGTYVGGVELAFALSDFTVGLISAFDFTSDMPGINTPFAVVLQGGQVVAVDGGIIGENFGIFDLSFTGRGFSYVHSIGHTTIEVEARLVPEPAGGVLMLAGLVALVARRRARCPLWG